MANKGRIALFGTVLVIAVVLVIGLVVHRSLYRDRLCKGSNNLYYHDPDTNSSSCLRSGTQGPCGTNMVLKEDRRNGTKGVGVCQCDVNHFDRPLIYHEESNQCYFIFTQGFCEDGQWLTVKQGVGPLCDTNICEDAEHPDSELVPLRDGRCFELGKYDNVTCNKSQIIRFFPRKVYPSCKPNLGQSIGSVGVPSTDCPDGYFRTGTGHCQPDFDFD